MPRLAGMQRRTALPWLVTALLLALVHALPSFYWATGGDALLWTVGSWAVDMHRENPQQTAVLLAIVGVVKVCGGVVPVLNARGLLPLRGLWTKLSIGGAALLIVYGAANILAGGASLMGLLGPTSSGDRHALLGHVLLWDPLFLLWGLALAAGLLTARRAQPVTPGHG